MADVVPEAHEATCHDCIASDLNKDIVVEDPYFTRIWRAVQLKKAGIPVLELVTHLDDAIAIHAVEAKISEIQHDKLKEERSDEDPEHE